MKLTRKGKGSGALLRGLKTYDKLRQLRDGLKACGATEHSHAFKRLKGFGGLYECVAIFERTTVFAAAFDSLPSDS